MRTVTISIVPIDVPNGIYRFCGFSISEGSDFQDYLEVTTVVVEPFRAGQNTTEVRATLPVFEL